MLQEDQIRKSSDICAGNYDDPKRSIDFETLNDFSDWLETQLGSLEVKHQGFATLSSVRSFLKR